MIIICGILVYCYTISCFYTHNPRNYLDMTHRGWELVYVSDNTSWICPFTNTTQWCLGANKPLGVYWR